MSKICNNCGNILGENDKFCTKCGTATGVTNTYQPSFNQSNINNAQNSYVNNSMAIAGMVLGLVAILLWWIPGVSVVLGILGLAFGIRGLSESKLLPNNSGKGMGVTGIVCGSMGLIAGAFWTFLVFLAIAIS